MVDEGPLYLADTRDHTATVVFPTETSRPRHDTRTYGACPGPVSRQFRPHGLNPRPGDNGRHTLYVVGHGDREAIEVFEVDMNGAVPTLTWVGCAVAPEALGLNSVVALPEGGFAATSPRTRDVWEWSTDAGWSRVPGSEDIGPNGLEISRDGQWFYVGGWKPVIDPLVARTDTGPDRRGGSRVSYRQRPLGPRRDLACRRSRRANASGNRGVHPAGAVRRGVVAGCAD